MLLKHSMVGAVRPDIRDADVSNQAAMLAWNCPQPLNDIVRFAEFGDKWTTGVVRLCELLPCGATDGQRGGRLVVLVDRDFFLCASEGEFENEVLQFLCQGVDAVVKGGRRGGRRHGRESQRVVCVKGTTVTGSLGS